MTGLEKVRKSKGLTQGDMASRIGIAVSTYSMYENGLRPVPLQVAQTVAEVLNCEINEIFLPQKFTVSKT